MEFEKIKAIITEQMSISEDKITLDTSLSDDLGADSLDIFQIISELEEEFNIEFTNEAAERIKTVADAIEYIKEHTGE